MRIVLSSLIELFVTFQQAKNFVGGLNYIIRTCANKKGISYGSHLTFKDADEPPVTPPEEEMEQLRMIEPY